MDLQLPTGIFSWGKWYLKSKTTELWKWRCAYIWLHFLRDQMHAFNTTSLLQIFSTRLPQHSLFSPPLFLKYLPLLKVNTSLFQIITSSHPCGSRYFIPLVLDSQFQNSSCWMSYRAAPSLTPTENPGMSQSSWLAMSTLRRVSVSSYLSGLPYLVWL